MWSRLYENLRSVHGVCNALVARRDARYSRVTPGALAERAAVIETWLRNHFDHKEIGWAEIGEKFTRYFLIKTRWFNVYLHQLDAPKWHPECHDHPWTFIALLLKGGYLEQIGNVVSHRRPGSILYRPATTVHNVITPFGTSWSIILTGPKGREWGFMPCENNRDHARALPYQEYLDLYKA